MCMSKIIACLDIDERKVVKGVQFENVKEVADPLTQAKKYVEAGVDELVFYDISASTTGRALFYDLIEDIAKETSVPFVVGGGIRSIEDVEQLLKLGADKVSINSIVIQQPSIVKELATRFGSEKIVVSMDVKKGTSGEWEVFAEGGRKATGILALEWAKQAEESGAGELVINSIAQDGVKKGYDLKLMQDMQEVVSIPLVASGGAGEVDHFIAAAAQGIEGLLAASVFHFNEVSVQDLKNKLKE